MEHQDWTPVVFHKPNQTNEKAKYNTNSGMTKQTRELINSNDIVLPPKIGIEFRKAMQSARNAKKISQKQLATILQVPPKTIMEWVENGQGLYGVPKPCLAPRDFFIVLGNKMLATQNANLLDEFLTISFAASVPPVNAIRSISG